MQNICAPDFDPAENTSNKDDDEKITMTAENQSIAIEVKALDKQFGPIHAVRDISFTVRHGEVLGFLGPNGAGKSTTMKMITGFLDPTSGTVIVNGNDVTTHPIEVKSSIGYLPEGAPSYGEMTVLSFLRFIAEIHADHDQIVTLDEQDLVRTVDVLLPDRRMSSATAHLPHRTVVRPVSHEDLGDVGDVKAG